MNSNFSTILGNMLGGVACTGFYNAGAALLTKLSKNITPQTLGDIFMFLLCVILFMAMALIKNLKVKG